VNAFGVEDTTMRKRIGFAFGLVACLGLAALVAWQLWPPRPGVTEANFRRLHAGMSEEEVRGVFGGPPNDDAKLEEFGYEGWKGEHCNVTLRRWERVESGTCTTDDGRELELPPEPTPFLDQLRRMLPW
jgi:hypothetical protein